MFLSSSWSFGFLFALVTLLSSLVAEASKLSFGVVTPNLKIRPTDRPRTESNAVLKAGRNEFEAFQIVFVTSGREVSDVSVRVSQPLSGPELIPADQITLYREDYYHVGTASNLEGDEGSWPDPLIPDRDVYFHEKRNAFPFDVPARESRVVWVDILVPHDATPGHYNGELEVFAGGVSQGVIPISLRVGNFTLPSTASLASSFGMGWADPCLAHTGDAYCGDTNFDSHTAASLRALYVRSALEHRFTIGNLDFQPPIYESEQPAFERYLLPYVMGTGKSRLSGAQVTSVILNDEGDHLSAWIDYAKEKKFFDRLLYYPVDEPGQNQERWNHFLDQAFSLHQKQRSARIVITSSFQETFGAGAGDAVDVFIPIIDQLEGRPGTDYSGTQRFKYMDWLNAKSNRELWSYQSCASHGCGACGEPTTDPAFSGWPSRVIDSSAVQNRAFPWHAYRLNITGELYFAATYQLPTAWDDNGQCAFSGSGDGTIFYPGLVSIIGGTRDIPVESLRMKMIREGMEDYEYLLLVAKKDPQKAEAIAQNLFPHTYESDQDPEELEKARDQLFSTLDNPFAYLDLSQFRKFLRFEFIKRASIWHKLFENYTSGRSARSL